MDSYLIRLLSISSQPISSSQPFFGPETSLLGDLSSEIREILSEKNGFYAFESALHFFPALEKESENCIDLNRWNNYNLWKYEYGSLIDNIFFFAEDLFGGQFCVKNERIYSFDPETGELDEISNNFSDFARIILDDYDFMTGFSLAHDWQLKHGKIPTGKRLIPKQFFVLGGEFVLDNLYLSDAVQGMKSRAILASKIHGLADDTEVKIRVE